MADVRRTLDGQSAGLLLANGTTRSIKSASLAPETRNAYSEYFCHIDYVLEAVKKGPVGLIRSGQPLVALKPRSEFDADWMRPHHMDDGLFVRLTDGSMPTCFLVAAPRRSEPFDTAERVKFVSALVPHLQHALRTQHHLDNVVQGANDVARAVDTVRHGIAVVDSSSAVIHLIPPPSASSAAATGCAHAPGVLKRPARPPTPNCVAASAAPCWNRRAVLAVAIHSCANDPPGSVPTSSTYYRSAPQERTSQSPEPW